MQRKKKHHKCNKELTTVWRKWELESDNPNEMIQGTQKNIKGCFAPETTHYGHSHTGGNTKKSLGNSKQLRPVSAVPKELPGSIRRLLSHTKNLLIRVSPVQKPRAHSILSVTGPFSRYDSSTVLPYNIAASTFMYISVINIPIC